jgi:hypothetical protein
VNSALPSSLLLLLFFLPFTWGRHRRARVTTALPGVTSLELLILFGFTLQFYLRFYKRFGVCVSVHVKQGKAFS